MEDFIISTDSTADLPEEYIQAHQLVIHPLFYTFDHEEVLGGDNDLPPKEFYSRMRKGDTPFTMASNPAFIRNTFLSQIQSKKSILHISFSSVLSGSFNNAYVCAKELIEEFPNANIKVIDSKCASLGQGLLVDFAVQMKESGKSLEETAAWLEVHSLNVCHLFTVNDLFYLQRGGRVSKTTAIIGTLINVKPILHVDKDGHLIPLSNVHGRKKSLSALVDIMGKKITNQENKIVFISHGDCLEDAEFVKNLIKERFGINEFLINYVSPTIGAHAGPGTVALFFMGNER